MCNVDIAARRLSVDKESIWSQQDAQTSKHSRQTDQEAATIITATTGSDVTVSGRGQQPAVRSRGGTGDQSAAR